MGQGPLVIVATVDGWCGFVDGGGCDAVSSGRLAFLGQDGKLMLQSLGKVLFKGGKGKATDDLAENKRHG